MAHECLKPEAGLRFGTPKRRARTMHLGVTGAGGTSRTWRELLPHITAAASRGIPNTPSAERRTLPFTRLPIGGTTRTNSLVEMRPRCIRCSILFETAGDTGCAVTRSNHRWCLSKSCLAARIVFFNSIKTRSARITSASTRPDDGDTQTRSHF